MTRPGSNVWYLRDSLSTGVATESFRYGHSREGARFMGDWDGDGDRTPGVLRGGTWFLRNTNDSGDADIVFQFRDPSGDVPVVGDWDGDGVDTPGWVSTLLICGSSEDPQARCRPAETHWELRNSNTTGEADIEFNFDGLGSPVVGNWDGDAADEVGTVRNGTWRLTMDLDRAIEAEFRYGQDGDIPVVGDWDGDGRDGPGVLRRGTWFIRNALTTGEADSAFRYGTHGDNPHTWR